MSETMEVYVQFKKDLNRYVLKVFLSFVILYTAATFMPVGLDSTDNGLAHSGLGLYIDNLIGCHYLSAGSSGSLTPRLTSQGTHICTGQD